MFGGEGLLHVLVAGEFSILKSTKHLTGPNLTLSLVLFRSSKDSPLRSGIQCAELGYSDEKV